MRLIVELIEAVVPICRVIGHRQDYKLFVYAAVTTARKGSPVQARQNIYTHLASSGLQG
jgi:hypothetical protein